jgi:hypothetical protein
MTIIEKIAWNRCRKSPRYKDSVDRIRNKLKVTGILFTGQSFSNSKNRSSFQLDPDSVHPIQYCEGWVTQLHVSWFKRLDSIPGSNRSISISPTPRYGFSNGHLNASVTLNYNTGKNIPLHSVLVEESGSINSIMQTRLVHFSIHCLLFSTSAII